SFLLLSRRRSSRLALCLTATEDLVDLLAAPRRDHARRNGVLQRVESRLHHVVRVRRSRRLRDDVLDAQRLEHGARRPTRDDAGTGRCRAHEHLARAEVTVHIVMERPSLAQVHPNHRASGLLRRLADRLRHFASLARAVAHSPLAVAGDHQRREAEAPATLHHLCDTIDRDELLDELGFVAVLAVAPWASSHTLAFLKLQSAFPGGV